MQQVLLKDLEIDEYFIYHECMYKLNAVHGDTCGVTNFAGIDLNLPSDALVKPVKTFTPHKEDD